MFRIQFMFMFNLTTLKVKIFVEENTRKRGGITFRLKNNICFPSPLKLKVNWYLFIGSLTACTRE